MRSGAPALTYTPAFQATIRDGHILPAQPDVLRAYLHRLDGQRVRVVVTKASAQRSISANNYLWGVVYPAIEEWSGHDVNELHAIFKAMFLPSRDLAISGKTITVQGSTSALDMDEFSAYVSKVKLWAAEQGVRVPEPNEVG